MARYLLPQELRKLLKVVISQMDEYLNETPDERVRINSEIADNRQIDPTTIVPDNLDVDDVDIDLGNTQDLRIVDEWLQIPPDDLSAPGVQMLEDEGSLSDIASMSSTGATGVPSSEERDWLSDASSSDVSDLSIDRKTKINLRKWKNRVTYLYNQRWSDFSDLSDTDTDDDHIDPNQENKCP